MQVTMKSIKLSSPTRLRALWMAPSGRGMPRFTAAKSAAKLTQLAKAKLPYISFLTDPTTGGVTASYAMLGDINIAEPKALIGFAGPRIIKDTVKKDLPDGFQRSEFLLEHGFLDYIIRRKELKNNISKMIGLFMD